MREMLIEIEDILQLVRLCRRSENKILVSTPYIVCLGPLVMHRRFCMEGVY